MAPVTTGHNLMMVLTAMRNFGIGANVRRTVWKNPGCYWTVTRVKKHIDHPYKRGKVWGQYYWNGRKMGAETEIGGVAKKQWLLDAEQTLEPEMLRMVPLPAFPKVVEAVEKVAAKV